MEIELSDVLAKYSGYVIAIIGIVFAFLGAFAQRLFDIFLERKRRKERRKEIFWQEKIEAAKSATEYYYQQIIMHSQKIAQYDMLLNDLPNSESLDTAFSQSIAKISQDLIQINDFKHHHINLFYNLDDAEFDQVVKNSLKEQQKYESFLDEYENNVNVESESSVHQEYLERFVELLTNLRNFQQEIVNKIKEESKMIKDDLQNFAS